MRSPQPATVLLGRIQLEQQRLNKVHEAVPSEGLAGALLDQLAGDRIRALLTDAQQELKKLARDVTRSGVTSPRLTTMANLQTATDRVLSEYLALALGAMARAANADLGACDEADRFIQELAGRIDRRFARPTVPGDHEHLHRAADVVRRRVPDHGLWDLPVMAHEFGHVVVSGLQAYDAVHDTIRRPVEPWLQRFTGPQRQQATELFCDVFATYALGPSYPCTLVLHRLDPTASAVAEQTSTHPGDASRVYACLWTLRKMQDGQKGPYSRFLGRLSAAWQALQDGAEQRARVDKQAERALISDLSACWVTLEKNLGSVRYEWSASVRDLVGVLEGGKTVPDSGDYSSADVLNAAWFVRLDAWSSGSHLRDECEQDARSLLQAAWERQRSGDAR